MPGREPWRPPRLRDVASVAGVSPATASRVLSNASFVDGQKARAVRDAVAALGYRPDAAACTQEFILVVTGGLERYGYLATLGGIQVAARELGAFVEVAIIDVTIPDQLNAWLDRILTRSCLGVIALEFDWAAVQLIGSLPDALPYVVAGGVEEGIWGEHAQCIIDDRAAARDATERLLALGHRQVHYLGVPTAGHPEPRLLGWQDALAAARVPVVAPLAFGWSASTGARVAKTIASDPTITAVLCGNDELAIGLISGLVQAGVRVPTDVSVVGFDDHPMAPYCQPPLTTVRQDFESLGRMAVQLLTKGQQPKQAVIIPTEFVERASVAPPR